MNALRFLSLPLLLMAVLWGTTGLFTGRYKGCGVASGAEASGSTDGSSDTLFSCAHASGQERIKCLLAIADSTNLQSPEHSFRASEQALNEARRLGNRQQEAESLFWMTLAEFHQANDKAMLQPLARAKACVELSQNHGYAVGVAKGYALMAGIRLYSDTAQVDSTLSMAHRFLAKVRHNPADSLWTAAYLEETHMGRAAHRGNLNACKEHALVAAHLYRLAGDWSRTGHAYESLFKLYIEYVPNLDSARYYLERCKACYRQSNAWAGLRSATFNYAIACSHHYQNSFDPIWYKEGTAAAVEAMSLMPGGRYAEAESQLGILYQQKAFFWTLQERPDSAKYYATKANNLYKSALHIAEQDKNEEALQIIAINLSSTCRLAGGCDTMMQRIAESYQKILEFRRIEAHKGQTLLERYKNEEAEQRRQNMLLGGGLLLAAISIFFLWIYQRARMRSLRRELEMKLEALRAQMNPHFISNCLNAIDSLINHGKNQEASHYIIRFSRLCRMVLNNARHKVISLSEELDMLDYFVTLEKLRFGDERLQYSVWIDPSLNKDEIAVPPMLLQPFVENAIWHGIQPKTGPGLVKVQVKGLDNGQYQCIIEDDGIGREKSKEIKSRSVLKQASLGMAITEERLQGFAKNKNEADLRIQDLYTDTGVPSGTKVIITLPIISL